jgi:AcrR family transcriptional regulator
MTSSARRQATRQRLFEAAVTLIAEQGFSATTVDEIAERAGVAKGTVYYNFASKNVLFEELLRHGVGLLTVSLRRAAGETASRGGTRVDALNAMIRSGLAFIVRYPSFTQLYVAALDWQAFQPERSLDDVHATLSQLLQGRVGGAAAHRTTR